MISVLINWCLIAITSYVTGYILFDVLIRLLGTDINNHKLRNIYRMLLGLAGVNVYAEIWSIFGGVGAWADFVLIIMTIIVAYVKRSEIVRDLKLKLSAQTVIHIALIMLWSYGTSRGYMHFDTNLYHAQAIRWIEEYGVVPGLVHLQSRFGYNSAEFALNALYSCKWFLGQSLHCTAGFFALISSFILVSRKSIIIKNDNNKWIMDVKVSDFVRLGLLFYLATIYAEIISPASDYYAQLLIFDIAILWLDNLESEIRNEQDRENMASIQGILCIILAYAITIKLSLGLLVLLALIPGIYWLKNKNVKSIATCIISGIIIAVPYFVRNYIISGWILYPSTFIRLGSPDWQLPIGEAQYDAKEIEMWGRGITNATEWDKVTMTNWIPEWIRGMSQVEKLWIIGTFLSIFVLMILITLAVYKQAYDPCLLLLIVLSTGAIFWFVSAPLVRYGYAYLIILPLAVIGYILTRFGLNASSRWNRASMIMFVFLAVGICGLKVKSLVEDIIRTVDYPYYIYQQDYIDGEASSYYMDGIEIFVADEAGQIGYYKFPSVIYKNELIHCRGKRIEDGFRKESNE